MILVWTDHEWSRVNEKNAPQQCDPVRGFVTRRSTGRRDKSSLLSWRRGKLQLSGLIRVTDLLTETPWSTLAWSRAFLAPRQATWVAQSEFLPYKQPAPWPLREASTFCFFPLSCCNFQPSLEETLTSTNPYHDLSDSVQRSFVPRDLLYRDIPVMVISGPWGRGMINKRRSF